MRAGGKLYPNTCCTDAWESNIEGSPAFAKAEGISLIVARTTKGAELLALAKAAGHVETTLFAPESLAAIQLGQREGRRALGAALDTKAGRTASSAL